MEIVGIMYLTAYMIGVVVGVIIGVAWTWRRNANA